MNKNACYLLLVSMSLAGCNANELESESDSMENLVYIKTLDVTYQSDNKEGLISGKISITPLENASNQGYYLVYFANEHGLLRGYDEIASIKCTGKTVNLEIKDGTYLPPEATSLAVFDSPYAFFDNEPDIALAGDVIQINNSKADLGDVEFKFAAVSDVHMNYDDYNRGASEKWQNALSFFDKQEIEHVIVTGDMTGDDNLNNEYQRYVSIINNSPIEFNNVYECIGNHGNTPTNISLFTKYTTGTNEVHPFENSPYYYVFIEENLFIFMAQEMKAPGDSAAYDNFSKNQIDWLEEVLNTYGNSNTNIFLIEHSPFLNYGAGDRHPGGYTGLVTFKPSYTQTMRLKKLLETYKDIIVLSGHTHLTFYDGQNYSNENGKFCRTVHISSTCQPNSYNEKGTFVRNTDGRYEVTPTYGSEGYVVELYKDYILFKGYNLTTNKLIPAACILLPKNI